MKGFLAGVGVCVVLFAVSSFAFRPWAGDMPSRSRGSGPIVLRDLPLNRAFNAVVPTQGTSVEMGFPPSGGVAITHVTVPQDVSNATGLMSIAVDGTTVAKRRLAAINASTMTLDFDFDPPIVVPPGSVLTVSIPNLIPQTSGNDFSFAGWTLAPGDV